MKKSVLIILMVFVGNLLLSAQVKLSNKSTVSVVTCGPGTELYSAFGHSAFRVYDPVLGIDKIYNYGTFDFSKPNFYLNFAKGKLTYELSTSNFEYFLRVFEYENRWVKTQILNLSENQVQLVFDFLENNAKPKNKSYEYDFFYDNCATKIEDVIKTVLKDSVSFSNKHIKTHKSQRELIADYTKGFKWAKFGIDLALGSVIDVEAPKKDYKFLPDYIYEGFENAVIVQQNEKKPLVKGRFTFVESVKQPNSMLLKLATPLILFTLISLMAVFITLKNIKSGRRTKWVDVFLLLFTGIIGLVVLLLWFATTHTATYKNFNFLWAFAPNLILAFFMLKSNLPTWIKYYLFVLLGLLFISLAIWVMKIQVFNIAVLPIILVLMFRYGYLIFYVRKNESAS